MLSSSKDNEANHGGDVKFSSALGVGESKLEADFSTEGSKSWSSFPWALTLLLAIICLGFGIQSEYLKLGFITFPISIALASMYGREMRACVLYGTFPLLLSIVYTFPMEDPISISLGGGPIALYFSNLFAFDFFSKTGFRRKLMSSRSNLSSLTMLAMIASFYYSEFNVNRDFDVGIGWSFDPFSFLFFLFFLLGMKAGRSTPVFLLLTFLASVAIFSNGLGFETSNGNSEKLVLSKIFFQSTYTNLGKLLSLPIGFFIGTLVRQRHQRKVFHLHALLLSAAALSAVVFLDHFRFSYNLSSFDFGYVVFGDKVFPGGSWPPEYMDNIIRMAGANPIESSGDFWYGALFDFDFGLAVVGLFTLLGYVWGIRGVLIGLVGWVLPNMLLLSALDVLPAYAAVSDDFAIPLFSTAEIFFEREALSSILLPKLSIAGTVLESGPNFVFAFFGAWLGVALDVSRKRAPTLTFFGEIGSFVRPPNPLMLVSAWIGLVFVGYELQSFAGVFLVWIIS